MGRQEHHENPEGQVQSPVPGTGLSSAMAQGWEPALVKRTCGSQQIVSQQRALTVTCWTASTGA